MGNEMWSIPLNTSGQAINPIELPEPDFTRPSTNAARTLMLKLVESLGLPKPKSRQEATQFFASAAADIFQKTQSRLCDAPTLATITKDEIATREDPDWTIVRADIIQSDAHQWFAFPIHGDRVYTLNQHMLIDDRDGVWFAWVPALDDNGNTVLREPCDAILEYASTEVLCWMTWPRTPGQWRLGWQQPSWARKSELNELLKQREQRLREAACADYAAELDAGSMGYGGGL